jgi:hypothetical protein
MSTWRAAAVAVLMNGTKAGWARPNLIRATSVAVVVAPFDNWGSGIVLARSPSSSTP